MRTWFFAAKSLKSGAPGRIRTHDPLVRSFFNIFPVRPLLDVCSSVPKRVQKVAQKSRTDYLHWAVHAFGGSAAALTRNARPCVHDPRRPQSLRLLESCPRSAAHVSHVAAAC